MGRTDGRTFNDYLQGHLRLKRVTYLHDIQRKIFLYEKALIAVLNDVMSSKLHSFMVYSVTANKSNDCNWRNIRELFVASRLAKHSPTLDS
jgi:hypothetical protein